MSEKITHTLTEAAIGITLEKGDFESFGRAGFCCLSRQRISTAPNDRRHMKSLNLALLLFFLMSNSLTPELSTLLFPLSPAQPHKNMSFG